MRLRVGATKGFWSRFRAFREIDRAEKDRIRLYQEWNALSHTLSTVQEVPADTRWPKTEWSTDLGPDNLVYRLI